MGKSASGKDKIYSRLAGNKELNLKKLILYTTRPVRDGEEDGVQYYFTDDQKLKEFEEAGKVIESRAYNTVYGVWTYFTADDGQIDLKNGNYLGIGTLESFQKMKNYYGKDSVIPIYIEVENGERLIRAIRREQEQETAGEVEHSGQPRQQFLHGKFFLSLPDVQGRKRTQKQRALRPLFCMYTITYFEVFVKYCFLPSKAKAIPHK